MTNETPKMTVYLAGPIDNCTPEECSEWRERMKKELPNIDFLDPMRRQFEGFDYQTGTWDDKARTAIIEEVVEGDKMDILNSDVVVANFWKIGVGTSMEILFAAENGVMTIVVAPKSVSPWVTYHAAMVVETLEEAIEQLKEVEAEFAQYEVAEWTDEE